MYLDFDLYLPTLEDLRFFYTRFHPRGATLVHDYFTPSYHGVLKAVDDFEKELGERITFVPVGDHCSIAILKHD